MCNEVPNQDQAVREFLSEMAKRFPSAVMEVQPEAMGGFHAWISIGVPEPLDIEAWEFASRLANEIQDRFDVSILTTTGPLEEAA